MYAIENWDIIINYAKSIVANNKVKSICHFPFNNF